MDIRTATITFHKAINYGAILQTYALQQAIIKLGIKNDIINYDCNFISKNYALINMTSIKGFIKSLLGIRNYYCKKKKFNEFKKKYIVLTKPVDKKTLNSDLFNNKYDFFITGSDQIWNYKITNLDETYFLDFVKEKYKINSYAASFGVNNIPNGLKGIYEKHLKRFSTILVREKTGINIVKKLINKEINIVLDPVFLLNKKEWSNIVYETKFDKIKDTYILIYMMTPRINEFAKILSKKYNLQIFNIDDLILMKKNRIGTTESKLGPEEFISAIKNAKFVITGSFHAVVFSIIFNKNFFINADEDGQTKISRQKDLLELLEIGDRDISNYSNDEALSLIDWEKVNKKLEIERSKSLKELKYMLNIKN